MKTNRNYVRSQEYLLRAEQVIPGGTQTFSKSKAMYPFGVSPYFVTEGRGSRVWDVDGNEYIDLASGLATINLGYNDADVTGAVAEQLQKGVIFSLGHPVEVLAAEALTRLVPCAEMVRFAKNGSDATSAAIRLARAYTNREHIAMCGYHGWHDWYIGATPRNRGVPLATQQLTHFFPYNDLEALRALFKEHAGKIAAVIMEPMTIVDPLPGYLATVKDLAHEHGVVLIFDEMVTGFRFALGGAQDYFNVTPDLATFGKGLANGYPLSAIAGTRKIMELMEEIFFSVTYGGEAISLAAAVATMKKLTDHPVVQTIANSGIRLKRGIEKRISRCGLSEVASVLGHPACTLFLLRDSGGYSELQLRTLYLQEMLARGVLTFGPQFPTYAHTDADIDQVLAVYDEVLPILKHVIETQSLEQHLRCKPLEPLFKLRKVPETVPSRASAD